jgi:hypothetical protein
MTFGDDERLQPLVDLEMLGTASAYRLASGAMVLQPFSKFSGRLRFF